MQKKLEVNNLTISFRTPGGKVQAVRDISFDLYQGETLAIVGESGSGKSVTNRAIMGISAGNSILESGQILYDGQDLVQISEEEFHKLRGDKIAMIFQDPMSSLNPIMKVGKQLTEAMLLKGKASQKSAKENFNSKLSQVKQNLKVVYQYDAEQGKVAVAKCETFDDFCIKGIKLESAYNEIYRVASELKLKVEETLFLLSKNQKVDVAAKAKFFLQSIKGSMHPDILVDSAELQEICKTLQQSKSKYANAEAFTNAVKSLLQIMEQAVVRPKPNYFTLGYYMMRNPNANVDDMPIEELTQMTQNYLDSEFLHDFKGELQKAVINSHNHAIALKRQAIDQLNSAVSYFNGEIEQKQSYALADSLVQAVQQSIDQLQVTKNGTQYTFKSSINNALFKYFRAVVNNPKEEKRYQRDLAKYNALVARGKNPDWKVVPPAVFDLQATKYNVVKIINAVIKSLQDDVNADATFDASQAAQTLIDYWKDQASLAVYKVTKKMARARALKLLEEVGIPEPAIRFNQFPFEFSGGMRQRIVIAIALAANPDILICDEPTTALDVTIQSQILELINRIKKERNLSVIFITHDLGVVANMADRIAVMYAGKIVECGTADDVFYDPRHPYTWALLSSMPDLDTKEKLEAIPGTPPNMIYPPVGDAFAARNKYAMEIDFEMQPPMFKVSDTHYAATWLLHPNAPKVAPPKIVTDRIERMKKEMAQHE